MVKMAVEPLCYHLYKRGDFDKKSAVKEDRQHHVIHLRKMLEVAILDDIKASFDGRKALDTGRGDLSKELK